MGRDGLPLPALTLVWKQLIKLGSQRRGRRAEDAAPQGVTPVTEGRRPLLPPLESSAGLSAQLAAAGNTGHWEVGAGVGEQPQTDLRSRCESLTLRLLKKKTALSPHLSP